MTAQDYSFYLNYYQSRIISSKLPFYSRLNLLMEKEERRYKGSRKDDGKIIKGVLKEAPLKLRASSIPSKIENVVYANHHKFAFGNSQERFLITNNEMINANVGPGNYNPSATYSKAQSKKGSGNFASSSKLNRFNDLKNWNPGPGRYQQYIKAKSSRSTAHLSSHLQSRQIFKEELTRKKNIPSPCEYEHRVNRSLSTANHVFSSKQNRFSSRLNETPAVGYYKWQDMKKKVFALKFAHKLAKGHENKPNYSKYLDNLIGAKTHHYQEIGPGRYDPRPIQSKRVFTIKQPQTDRFPAKQADISDSYNNIANTNEQKMSHTSPSPSFKSKSKRYQFGERQREQMGDPCNYSPTKPGKQSHMINFENKWV